MKLPPIAACLALLLQACGGPLDRREPPPPSVPMGWRPVDALNLDGGGSSTLVVEGVLVNRPAGDRVEREVMSALAVFCDR